MSIIFFLGEANSRKKLCVHVFFYINQYGSGIIISLPISIHVKPEAIHFTTSLTIFTINPGLLLRSTKFAFKKKQQLRKEGFRLSNTS